MVFSLNFLGIPELGRCQSEMKEGGSVYFISSFCTTRKVGERERSFKFHPHRQSFPRDVNRAGGRLWRVGQRHHVWDGLQSIAFQKGIRRAFLLARHTPLPPRPLVSYRFPRYSGYVQSWVDPPLPSLPCNDCPLEGVQCFPDLLGRYWEYRDH